MNLSITLRELSPIIQSLNTFVQVPIPAKYSWRLSKVMEHLQSEVDGFNQHRNELFEKYGEEVDNADTPPGMPGAKSYKIKPEHVDDFQKELNELLYETVSINFEPIPVSLVAESEMSIADITNLSVFFLDDSPEMSEVEVQPNAESIAEVVKEATSA